MKLDLTLTSYIKPNKTLKVNTFDASSLNLIVTTETTVRECMWNYQEAKEEEVDMPRTTTEGLSLTLEEVDYVIKMLNKARVHMVEQLENLPVDDYSLDDDRFNKIQSEAGKDLKVYKDGVVSEEYRGGGNG